MEPPIAALTLRRARELAGLDLQEASQHLGLRPRQLRAYEDGRSPVPTSVLSAAVTAYGAPEVVIPPRRSLQPTGDPRYLVVGAERIPLAEVRHGNRVLLQRYLAAVRRQRGIGPGEEVGLRSADVATLAGLLDLTDADLERQLQQASGSTTGAAHHATRSLVLSGLVLLAIGASVGGGSSPSPGPGHDAAVAPTAEIGVALVIERGGVQTVRTGLEAFPAKGLPWMPPEVDGGGAAVVHDRPAGPETGRDAGEQEVVESESGASPAAAPRSGGRQAERDAERVARREEGDRRRAELQAQQEASARRQAEEAGARAEERSRSKAGPGSPRGSDIGQRPGG